MLQEVFVEKKYIQCNYIYKDKFSVAKTKERP